MAFSLLERLLCEELLPPPDTLEIEPPPRDPDATTRERFAAHSANETCAVCHVKIDGAGFGLENFDPIGAFRTMESNKEVNSKGKIYMDGGFTKYNGAYELSGLLAQSEQAKKQFCQAGLSTPMGLVASEKDQCAISSLGTEFDKGNLKTLWIDFVTSRAARVRDSHEAK